jgi:hypothetical protein
VWGAVVCYNDWYRYPVVGTKGGDSYVDARDAADAADVLTGVGAMVLAGGVVLLFGSAMVGSGGEHVPYVAPLVSPRYGGVVVGARF